MESFCVQEQKSGRLLRILLCSCVFSAASACSVDVTDLTPFAKKESEARVARATKANPVNPAAVANVAGNKSRDRIATQPVYALASAQSVSQNAKLTDRIFVPASEVRQGTGVASGNTAVSVERVAASPGQVALPSAASYVVVSRGDTLYSIARRSGVKLSELMSLNKIDSPAGLRVGQRLQIPGSEAGAKPKAESNTLVVSDALPSWRSSETVVITPVAATRELRVTLTSGTTMYSIARAHGVTVAELARANGIVDPTKVRAGTVLTIPGQGRMVIPTVSSASAPQSKPNIQDTDPLVTGAVPASERDFGALARARANRKAAAIASYQRTAIQYRLTPGQTILVPF